MPTVRVDRGVEIFCPAPLRGRVVLLFFFKASLLFAPVSALIDLKLQTSIIDWPSHPISGWEKQQVNSAAIEGVKARIFRLDGAHLAGLVLFYKTRQNPSIRAFALLVQYLMKFSSLA